MVFLFWCQGSRADLKLKNDTLLVTLHSIYTRMGVFKVLELIVNNIHCIANFYKVLLSLVDKKIFTLCDYNDWSFILAIIFAFAGCEIFFF